MTQKGNAADRETMADPTQNNVGKRHAVTAPQEDPHERAERWVVKQVQPTSVGDSCR